MNIAGAASATRRVAQAIDALRHGWAANGTILPYTYDSAPPVPDKPCTCGRARRTVAAGRSVAALP